MTFPIFQAARRIGFAIVAVGLLLVTGCNGCFQNTVEEDDPNAKVKPNFESLTPVTLPGYYPLDPEERKKVEEEAKDDDRKRQLLSRLDPAFRFNRTKLGHWVSIDFLAIANNFNAEGILETRSTQMSNPLRIESTDYFVASSRPVSLTKGEWKKLETSVFLPRKKGVSNQASIAYRLDGGGSLPLISETNPVTLLEDYQYHMVLLSSRPDSMKYLSFLDCVKLPGASGSLGDDPLFYSIVPTTKDDPIPLPQQSMNWTTIAYIVWDDLDPDLLSRQQQEGLLDWLHFGGQIVFSGPDCIDRLQNSFLANYLPGQFEESVPITNKDIVDLNTHWSVPVKKNPSEKRTLQLPEKSPLPTIRFKPHEDASFVENTGELALERRIGRGRVVATAFSLTNKRVVAWRSFSSFFHNALLRKPARTFARTRNAVTSFRYNDDGATIFDPLAGSTLRYISRDLSSSIDMARETPTHEVALSNNYQVDDPRTLYMVPNTKKYRNPEDALHYGGFQSTRQSGVAGWNDESGVASAARETLKNAARISPPSATFVLKMLAIYLIVLVPLNWLLFRVIGKVEWAWIAAPIIALTGAFAVVKYASLDIGFVRSVTHVGVLELHGDYPRGHLTDFAALYTSLSTRYEVELDNLSGQSLPLAKVSGTSFRPGESLSKVELKRTTTTDLKNFLVRSNSTGLLHTEMMLDVGGTLRLVDAEDRWTVENQSLINLQDAGVLRRTESGDVEFAWVGSLDAGSESDGLEFAAFSGEIEAAWSRAESLVGSVESAKQIWEQAGLGPDESVELEQLVDVVALQPKFKELSEILNRKMVAIGRARVNRGLLAAAMSELEGMQSVSLSSVFQCVSENLQLGIGEVRLIGRTTQKLDQTKYKPAATQALQELLVVVHLNHAKLPECRRDENSISDFEENRSNLNQEDDSFIARELGEVAPEEASPDEQD